MASVDFAGIGRFLGKQVNPDMDIKVGESIPVASPPTPAQVEPVIKLDMSELQALLDSVQVEAQVEAVEIQVAEPEPAGPTLEQQVAELRESMQAFMSMMTQLQALQVATPPAPPAQVEQAAPVVTVTPTQASLGEDEDEPSPLYGAAKMWLARNRIKYGKDDAFGGVKPSEQEVVDFAIGKGFNPDAVPEPKAKKASKPPVEHGQFRDSNGDIGAIDLTSLREFVLNAPVGQAYFFPKGTTKSHVNHALGAAGITWEANYPQKLPITEAGGQTFNYPAAICARGGGRWTKKYGMVTPQLALDASMDPHKRFIRAKARCIVRVADNLPLPDYFTDYAAA